MWNQMLKTGVKTDAKQNWIKLYNPNLNLKKILKQWLKTNFETDMK